MKIQSPEKSIATERNRPAILENLEARQLMTASVGWDGPGLGSAELQYYIGTAPSSLSQAAFEESIQTALDAWSEVVDVQFVRTNIPGQNNCLDFGVGTIDGKGDTLAVAYFPDDVNSSRIAGDVQFDASENWEVGNAMGSLAYDIVLIAAHEIGHALGLDHLHDAGSILLPSVSSDQQFSGLDQSDVQAIR
jgi:Matrixin